MILSSFIVCYVFAIFLLFLACLPLLMLMLTFILISLNEGFNPGFIFLDGIAYERVGIVIVSNYAMHLGTLYLTFVTIHFFFERNEPCTFCDKSVFLCSVAPWKIPFSGGVFAIWRRIKLCSVCASDIVQRLGRLLS